MALPTFAPMEAKSILSMILLTSFPISVPKPFQSEDLKAALIWSAKELIEPLIARVSNMLEALAALEPPPDPPLLGLSSLLISSNARIVRFMEATALPVFLLASPHCVATLLAAV